MFKNSERGLNLDIELKENFDIKNLTTFKVGGIVKKVYFPKSQGEFLHLMRTEKNPIILGACSNIIFSSQGCDNTIICTSKMSNLQIRGTKIITECGVKGAYLAQKALEAGLSGFEFMIGFPGTMGGNIFMNAGAHNQSIADTLSMVCVYDKDKDDVIYLSKQEMQFGYRHSVIQDKKYIVLGAEFDLKKENPEKIKDLMDRNLEFRKNIQPSLVHPNAGSIFKNPEHDSAGRLLDKAGVKGLETPNALVWNKHANFIVNKGNASSQDILELMLMMYNKVKRTYTIELIPEVRYIGKMNKREEEICKELYKKNQK